jgi:hypothetical protein
VHIQVGDNFITVVQNGVVKGQIDRIPAPIMDVLRGFRDLILVELRWEGDRRVPKAQHRALVQDIGAKGVLESSMARWQTKRRTTRPARGGISEETEQWIRS